MPGTCNVSVAGPMSAASAQAGHRDEARHGDHRQPGDDRHPEQAGAEASPAALFGHRLAAAYGGPRTGQAVFTNGLESLLFTEGYSSPYYWHLWGARPGLGLSGQRADVMYRL
jgi:hypothetical protein